MKRLKLYIETSAFGFYYDMAMQNKGKRAAVRKLFQQIKDEIFEGYISGLVIDELQRAPRPHQERFLALIDRYTLKRIAYDEDEVGELYQRYLEAKVVPASVADDAAHVAIASVGGVDVARLM